MKRRLLKMSNTYLRYLLKEHKKSIIIIYIIVSLLTVSSVLFTYIDPEEVPLFYSHVVVSYANSLVGFLTFILLLFVPLSRSMFFKKQTVDMFNTGYKKRDCYNNIVIHLFVYTNTLFTAILTRTSFLLN